MKDYTLSKIDKYSVRQGILLKSFERSNLIKIDILGFSSEVQVTVTLLLDNVNSNKIQKIPLIEVWSCWRPGETRVNTKNKQIVDVSELKVIEPNGLKVFFEYNKGTIFYADLSGFTKKRNLIINFVFKTVSLLYRLKEAEPYNRFILSFSCQIHRYVVNRSRLIIRRPKRAATRFTKGNFILATPALESEKYLLTNIYYDNSLSSQNLIFLQYGFGNAEVDWEMSPWVILLIGGLGILVILSLLFGIGSTQRGTIEVPGSLIALTLTLFETTRRYLSISRHKIYTGKKSYIEISMTLIIIGFIASLSAIIIRSFLSETFPYLLYFLLILLVYDGVLIFASVCGIVGLRMGAWQRYECDMPFCNKLLYLRTRTKECITTGRVICNSCFSIKCINCACVDCEQFNCDVCLKKNKYLCLHEFEM